MLNKYIISNLINVNEPTTSVEILKIVNFLIDVLSIKIALLKIDLLVLNENLKFKSVLFSKYLCLIIYHPIDDIFAINL